MIKKINDMNMKPSKRKNFRKKSISIFLLLIFLNSILFPTASWALTIGPNQPEFSNFTSAESSEMVNLFTGDFSYNIPLMDIEGYPINGIL